MNSLLRTGAMAKDFELAIEWLKDAGLIHKVTRVRKPGLPMIAHSDRSDFTIYLNDGGSLTAMAEIMLDIILNGNPLFTAFKGILAEQFVLQKLISRSIRSFTGHLKMPPLKLIY